MERKSYIKVVPRRFTPDSEIVSIGSNQYTTQWIDVEPEAVYQDRGNVSPTNLGAFTWNSTTKTLTFTTTSAPNENIFIDYPLRFCTGVTENLQDDPATPSGSVVTWSPRLKKHPSIPESASNMLNGVLSTSSTSVTINNQDYALNKYLTKYDNYKNRPAKIYGQLGSVVKKLGFGYITKTRSGSDVVISIKSTTKLLEATATLANRDSFYEYTRSKWPNLEVGFDGKAIPVQYGYINQITPETQTIVWQEDPPPSTIRLYQEGFPNDQIMVRCPYLGSNQFFMGIIDSPFGLSGQEYITLTNFIGNYTYQVSSSDIGYFIKGEYLTVLDNAETIRGSGIIIDIDYDNNYIQFDAGPNSASFTKIGMPPVAMFGIRKATTGATITRSTLASLSISSIPTPFNPSPSLTWSFETTDSGQYMVYANLSGSLITSYSGQPAFAVLRSKPISQSNFVKKYVESTGVSADTTSFTQAQTDANANVMITVNKDFKLDNIRDVVESIVTSCNGILYLDSTTNKYKYKIVSSSLSGVDYEISKNDILEPDLIPNIDYEDTASVVNMYHPYTDGFKYLDAMNTSQSSSFSRAFNSESKSKTINHYLTDVTSIVDLKSETYNTPQVTYTFTVMADYFFDVDIGDIVQIQDVGDRLLSESTSIKLLVIARTRSVEKIKLVGYEFTKIP